jgi:hypothetical protein
MDEQAISQSVFLQQEPTIFVEALWLGQASSGWPRVGPRPVASRVNTHEIVFTQSLSKFSQTNIPTILLI